jgi:hypothetical protein
MDGQRELMCENPVPSTYLKNGRSTGTIYQQTPTRERLTYWRQKIWTKSTGLTFQKNPSASYILQKVWAIHIVRLGNHT